MHKTKIKAKQQTIANIKAEINFREKLAKQHVTGEVLLPNYYLKEEHDKILIERVDKTKLQMEEFKERGLNLSPFVELGAERGQRSLVLQNDFAANGIALDISYAQLKTMEYFAEVFNRKNLPLRVCGNAYKLPIRTNSLPFTFCYAFLHHFPTPEPIVQEIYRVLADGYFFFGSEPFKKGLQLKLYKQRKNGYLSKNKYWNFLEKFIAEGYCEEVENGIIENDDISLKDWLSAFSIFTQNELNLETANKMISSQLGNKVSLSNIPNWILGGSISGLCYKSYQKVNIKEKDIKEEVYDILGCPNCTIPMSDGSFDRPPLTRYSDFFKCNVCSSEYPIIDGIVVALTPEDLRELYPDFVKH